MTLAAQGCFVTVAGRRRESLHETVRLVKEAGGDEAAVLCDVADEESVARATEAAAGPINGSTSG